MNPRKKKKRGSWYSNKITPALPTAEKISRDISSDSWNISRYFKNLNLFIPRFLAEPLRTHRNAPGRYNHTNRIDLTAQEYQYGWNLSVQRRTKNLKKQSVALSNFERWQPLRIAPPLPLHNTDARTHQYGAGSTRFNGSHPSSCTAVWFDVQQVYRNSGKVNVNLLSSYTTNVGSFPGVEWKGRDADHPPLLAPRLRTGWS